MSKRNQTGIFVKFPDFPEILIPTHFEYCVFVRDANANRAERVEEPLEFKLNLVKFVLLQSVHSALGLYVKGFPKHKHISRRLLKFQQLHHECDFASANSQQAIVIHNIELSGCNMSIQ